MKKGSMLRPLKTLAFLGREPVTLPMVPRPASENYRGFHLNDWGLCIGCGTCSTICDNRAIHMVAIPDLPSDPVRGVRARRPAIDYGRCCWCGLCVDICPTGSLSLSQEYIHVSADLDTFFVLPDPRGIHGFGLPKGWAKSPDSDLLDLRRQPLEELPPPQRLQDFSEIVQGFDAQSALLEASRCIQCGMCHDACPTHMNAPEYIRALWSGDAEEAVRQIYRTNPLAHVCGRVCTHRCEIACSIGKRGEPISIRWLKRFAMDSVSHERIREIASEGSSSAPTGRTVAIIGAGPAGLTVAYDLARQGHKVKIFEAQPRAGGMTRYGIPEYRLPYHRLDEDIDIITAMGVEIQCSTRVGEDVTFSTLQQQFDAVLIAVGLWAGRSTRIPGSDHAQVVSAIELLRNVTMGINLEIPKSAVVIGGGNVAMDAARTLARLQRQRFGAVSVTVTSLEVRNNMLADLDEIREAEEEGVTIVAGRGPRSCTVETDRLTGLETVACVAVFDDQGRFHPRYDEADVAVFEAQMVVEAIGQTAQLDFLGKELVERLEWDRGRLRVREDGRTSEPWLWAAGDVVEGPDVIHAVAAGHRAAVGIHAYLLEHAAVLQ